jgi:hypothetical protein
VDNINKRIEKLEKLDATDRPQSQQPVDVGVRYILKIPDNGRGQRGFQVFDPLRSRVMLVPQWHSVWADGERVFDSLSNRPPEGTVRDLSAAQWEELRKAEPLHQRKESQ